MTGGDDPYDDDIVLKKLFHPNLKLLIVTEGSKGCRYYTKVCFPNQFWPEFLHTHYIDTYVDPYNNLNVIRCVSVEVLV